MSKKLICKLSAILKIGQFAMLASLFVFKSLYAGDILTSVDFSEKADMIEMKVHFSKTFSYRKHFPTSRGKIIQVLIKPDDENVDAGFYKKREMINPEKSAPIGIRDIIFEGNVKGGPYLVIRFQKIETFTLSKEKNSNVLTVQIKSSQAPSVSSRSTEGQETKQNGSKNEKADQMMREAKNALTRGDNVQAILLFSQLLDMPGHSHIHDAKEYLGLARERSGQLELAKKEYEDYLRLYPKVRRAETVKQRLMTLNARLERRKTRQLAQTKRSAARNKSSGAGRNDFFGRLSQIYFNAWMDTETKPSSRSQNQLLSFFDVTKRFRNEKRDLRLAFNASSSLGLLEKGTHEARVRSIYAKYKGHKNKMSGSIGRLSVSSGGVLGRFDGFTVGYEYKPKWFIHGVLGAPVNFSEHQKIQTNRPLYGMRLQSEELFTHWKGSSYIIKQDVSGITDRFAIGTDARYFRNRNVFYALLDYDVSYKVLNFLTAHYGTQASAKTKLDVHFDRRRSPVMLTSNAANGLTSITDKNITSQLGIPSEAASSPGNTVADRIKRDPSIKKLLDEGVSEDVIRGRAIENTGHSTLISIGMTHQTTKDLQVNTNLTLSKYTPGTSVIDEDDENKPPKDSIFALDGFDYMFSGQFILRELLFDRDTYMAGARLSNNNRSKRYSVNFSARAPYGKSWRFNGRLNVVYTKNTEKNLVSGKISPSFKAEYRWTKKMTFETNFGVDINKTQAINEDYVWSYINFGYRYIF